MLNFRLWVFHEKPSKHLTVFSSQTVSIKQLANLTVNTKNYRQITLNTKRHSDSLNIKIAEKEKKYSRQRYLWTLCRSVIPRRCTTRFRPAVRLCQLEMVPRCFPISCPWQDSEGKKSRPLDHMRQIPFFGASVPPYWLKLRFSHVYIWQCGHFIFHVVRFEVWACPRAKTI